MSNYNITTPPETATSEDNFAMVDQEDIPGENKPVLASIQG